MSSTDNILEQISKRIAVITVVFLCAIQPFISDPNGILLYKTVENTVDRFGYIKWISLLCIGGIVLFVLTLNILRNSYSGNMIYLSLPLMLFTIWCLISTFMSTDFKTSFLGLFCSYQGLTTYFIYFMIVTLIINYYDDIYSLFIQNVLIICPMLMAFLVVNESFDSTLIEYLYDAKFRYATKVHATLGNSNFVGSYFSLMFPFATIVWLRSTASRVFPLHLLSTVTNYFGLVYSVGRVSWIASLISCLICIILLRNKQYLVRFLILLSVLVVFTALIDTKAQILGDRVEDFYHQTKNISTNADDFGSGRLFAFKNFARLSVESPKNIIFGVGLECLVFYESYANKFGKAHSDLIEFAATMGYPALIFYLYFCGHIFFRYLKTLATIPIFTSAIFAAWLGYLIQSFFNAPCIGVVEIFFVFSGILLKHLISGQERPSGFSPVAPVIRV
jgi:hypothetical protein